MRKKILVTGCNGQLGNEIRELASLYAADFFFHDYDTLNIANEQTVEQFCTEIQPDILINCAAYTAVDKAENDIDAAFEINTKAMEILAKASAKFNFHLVHISTDYVFDGQHCLPYKETDSVCPQGVYGKSKLEGEQNIFKYAERATIIRTAWLYSSFGNNFVKTIRKHAAVKEQLTVVFDQIGTPTYAHDLAKAILDAMDKLPQKVQLFHFSNEGVCSWYDFAQEIVTLSKLNCKILPIETKDYPTPAKRPAFSVLNKGLFKETFGQEIPYWKTSLAECIKKLDNA